MTQQTTTKTDVAEICLEIELYMQKTIGQLWS